MIIIDAFCVGRGIGILSALFELEVKGKATESSSGKISIGDINEL